jgi:hypothetical protein
MELQIQPDQDYFRQRLQQLLDALRQAHGATAEPIQAADSPALLEEALFQLLDIIARVESDARATDSDRRGKTHARQVVRQTDITELGEYSIGLLGELEHWLQRYHLEEQQALLAEVQMALALWVARHGGELLTLEPVVDALALFANRTLDPEQLVELFAYMGEIVEAVAPAIRQDLEKTHPGRPWRVLNLNRAIVATRSHDPKAIEEAYSRLAELLPEEAPRFFAEGMEQMEALDYPPHVRSLVENYYHDWNRKHRLH